MRDLIRLLRLYAPYRAWVLAGIGFGLLTVLANFALLALSGWFLAATGVAGVAGYAAQNVFNFFTPAAGVRFFATLRVLARYAGRLVDHEATFRLLARLRMVAYAGLEPLAPVGLAGERGGDLLSRLVADIDRLGDFFLRVVSPFAIAAAAALVMALGFAIVSPAAALLLVLGLIVAGIAVPLASLGLGRRPASAAVALQATMRADLVDSIQGMAELLTCNASGAMADRVDAASAALLAAQRRLAAIAGFGVAAILLASGLTMLAILPLAGALADAHRIAGPVVALLALGAMAAFEAVAPLPAAFQLLGGMADSARRVFDLLDRPPPVAEPAASPPRPARLDLILAGVSLRYPGAAHPALAGIDLSIAEGEHVTILGRSGAGKTSLFNLLLRFAPPEAGRATIGGVDLAAIRGDDLRSLFTVVSQTTAIFAGTLRDNLLLARPDADDAALWRALETARLAEFVRTRPGGLDSLVGEAGAKLSGGEARRLSLARAALRATPFLLLDEPTEGLDPLTEAEFRRALAGLAAGRTVIAITHRLDHLADDDRVVMLEQGRIVADGSFGALRRGAGPVAHLSRLLEISRHF